MTVAGGTPTLTLNDGGIATYTGGSGSNALTFSYTVAAGQNTAALAATAVNLNSATITDGAGNAANLSLSGLTQSGPQIDTTTPTIASLDRDRLPTGDLNAGKTVTFTLNLNEAVTVAGGTPDADPQRWRHRHLYGRLRQQCAHLQLHRGAGQNTAALAATAVNLNSATITDGAGNAANLSLSGLTQSGPQIDTTTPTIASLDRDRLPPATSTPATPSPSPSTSMKPSRSPAARPTLTLNDGGIATYTGGSGSNALTFSYTVGGRPEHRGARRHRRQSQLRHHHRRRRQCRQPLALRSHPERPADRHHNTDHRVAGPRSPSTGDLNAGKTVTLTLNLNEVVTVAGGTPDAHPQ